MEGTNLGVRQITEEQRRLARPLLRCRSGRVKTAPLLSLGTRHIGPPNLMRVLQDAGMDGLMFSGCGHQSAFLRFLGLGSPFTASSKSFSTCEAWAS